MEIGKSVMNLVCGVAFDSIFYPVRESLFHTTENTLMSDMVYNLVYDSVADSIITI